MIIHNQNDHTYPYKYCLTFDHKYCPALDHKFNKVQSFEEKGSKKRYNKSKISLEDIKFLTSLGLKIKTNHKTQNKNGIIQKSCF